MQGIYKLRNNINDKIYIGQSKDVESRFVGHVGKLRDGKHNLKLQTLFNENIEDVCFMYEFIEPVFDKKDLLKAEGRWIDFFNSVEGGYNINKETRSFKIDNSCFELNNRNNDWYNRANNIPKFKTNIIFSTTLDYNINDTKILCLNKIINKTKEMGITLTILGDVTENLILMQSKLYNTINKTFKKVEKGCKPSLSFVILSKDGNIILYSTFALMHGHRKKVKDNLESSECTFCTIHKNFIGMDSRNDILFFKNYFHFLRKADSNIDFANTLINSTLYIEVESKLGVNLLINELIYYGLID